MKIVLVTGTRDSSVIDDSFVYRIYREINPALVIHGDCPSGIDNWFKRQCELDCVPQIPMPARWDYYRNSNVLLNQRAGLDRNYDMCKVAALMKLYGNEVICLAFPKGDDWTGTRHCMQQAGKWGIEVKEFML